MTKHIKVLDVREILKAKQEPFQHIMEAVGRLEEEDIFELHATFRPEPLLRVLGKQGFQHAVMEEAPDHVVVQFYKETDRGASPGIPFFHLDNRGLEPPQPMVRTLELLEEHNEFQTGELGLEIWNERVPAFLLPELDDLGFSYEFGDEGNGTVRVRIFKKR